MKKSLVLLSFGLLAATGATLSACGKRGTLETPAPMWGDKQRTPPNANKRADQRTPDPYHQENRTSRQAPMEGATSDPRSAPATAPR